ncbi:MAG: DUF3179 domain-containing protein [Acidimicrobiia bacterium]
MNRGTALFALLAVALAACAGATVSSPSSSTTDQTLPAAGRGGTTLPNAPTTTIDLTDQDIPRQLQPMAERWNTDFTKATVDLNELLVGIPASDPRDLIPPIDDPVFEVAEQSTWVADREPGAFVEVDGDARFYPLSVMIRHEIVNDEIGGVPVAVTYCPLCNTALAFDRRLDGVILRFGVSGLLRKSDLVMWDNATESLWQQITGEAIVGELAGERLTQIPTAIIRWADFKAEYPQGQVLGPDQGLGSVYGTNPYEYYSSRSGPYSFYQGEIDNRYPALERVVGVLTDAGQKAYPFSLLAESRVANDQIGDQPVVIFWGAADTADALDAGNIAEAAAVGTAVAYNPVVNGRRLTFEALDDTEFTDLETGSTWNILGRATSGELAGAQLEILPHRNEFWFAWQGFFGDAPVWEG